MTTSLTEPLRPVFSEAPQTYSLVRQARDEVSDALSTGVYKNLPSILGGDLKDRQDILNMVLFEAVSTVKKYPISFKVQETPRHGFPSFTLSTDVLVTYADDFSSISWVFKVTIIPGHPPFFHRETVGGPGNGGSSHQPSRLPFVRFITV
jgi:hypothetical protein